MPDLIEAHDRVRESSLMAVEEFLAEGRGGHNTPRPGVVGAGGDDVVHPGHAAPPACGDH